MRLCLSDKEKLYRSKHNAKLYHSKHNAKFFDKNITAAGLVQRNFITASILSLLPQT